MFRAHVLIVRRAALYYRVSGIITPIGDKTHHTKHTTTHRKGTLIAKTSVFTEQDARCGNSSTQSQAAEDGYINVRNMLSA